MCRVYAMDIKVPGTSRDSRGFGSVSEPFTSSPSISDPVKLQVLTPCMMENHHLYYVLFWWASLYLLTFVCILASASTASSMCELTLLPYMHMREGV